MSRPDQSQTGAAGATATATTKDHTDSVAGTERNIVVDVSDMPEENKVKAIDVVNAALDKHVRDATKGQRKPDERKELEREIERRALQDVAMYVKKAFDEAMDGTWHCIVGRSFGSFVSYERMCFVHLTVDGTHIMLWKHG